MRWLYRLQARTGLTDAEGIAALVLVAALAAGGLVHHRQATVSTVPADFYAAADAAFAVASRAEVPADSGAPTAAPVAQVGSPSGSSEADSSAAAIAEAEVEAAAAPRRTTKPPPVRTNINTASLAGLQRLPRIGPALAGRIVDYRRTHGPFQHPDEIVEVKGIGEKTLEKLRPWIYI